MFFVNEKKTELQYGENGADLHQEHIKIGMVRKQVDKMQKYMIVGMCLKGSRVARSPTRDIVRLTNMVNKAGHSQRGP